MTSQPAKPPPGGILIISDEEDASTEEQAIVHGMSPDVEEDPEDGRDAIAAYSEADIDMEKESCLNRRLKLQT